MAATCLLIGLAVGPVLIAAFAGAERIAPPERISTVLTVLSTALVVGVATGSALAGQVVDLASPSAAAWIAVAGPAWRRSRGWPPDRVRAEGRSPRVPGTSSRVNRWTDREWDGWGRTGDGSP
ncbi:MAG: hypothetical protein R2719_12025 [Micropruina sp.]